MIIIDTPLIIYIINFDHANRMITRSYDLLLILTAAIARARETLNVVRQIIRDEIRALGRNICGGRRFLSWDDIFRSIIDISTISCIIIHSDLIQIKSLYELLLTLTAALAKG